MVQRDTSQASLEDDDSFPQYLCNWNVDWAILSAFTFSVAWVLAGTTQRLPPRQALERIWRNVL